MAIGNDTSDDSGRTHTPSLSDDRSVYLLHHPAYGDVAVVVADSITHAASLVPRALDDGVDPAVVESLADSGWPAPQHITEIPTDEPLAQLLDGGGEP